MTTDLTSDVDIKIHSEKKPLNLQHNQYRKSKRRQNIRRAFEYPATYAYAIYTEYLWI